MEKQEYYDALLEFNPHFIESDGIIYKKNLTAKLLCYLLFVLIVDILIIVSYA